MLAILREIEKHIGPNFEKPSVIDNLFKIIYISPMKALAGEIERKFSLRLSYLGIKVRELSGDMQLTKKEIEETHIILTTPEKWDVVTRKANAIQDVLKLIIIDEIHLLNDDRGPVLECLVARTI